MCLGPWPSGGWRVSPLVCQPSGILHSSSRKASLFISRLNVNRDRSTIESRHLSVSFSCLSIIKLNLQPRLNTWSTCLPSRSDAKCRRAMTINEVWERAVDMDPRSETHCECQQPPDNLASHVPICKTDPHRNRKGRLVATRVVCN